MQVAVSGVVHLFIFLDCRKMLGKLEVKIVEILWDLGNATVHDVISRLDRQPAYTTVMTVLDRLHKKGVLKRRKKKRAFRYMPKFSRAEWKRKEATEWCAHFLTGSTDSHLILSSLVDAIGQQDSALLDELERKIALKRKQLTGRENQ